MIFQKHRIITSFCGSFFPPPASPPPWCWFHSLEQKIIMENNEKQLALPTFPPSSSAFMSLLLSFSPRSVSLSCQLWALVFWKEILLSVCVSAVKNPQLLTGEVQAHVQPSKTTPCSLYSALFCGKMGSGGWNIGWYPVERWLFKMQPQQIVEIG